MLRKSESNQSIPFWHVLSIETIYSHLESGPCGISGTEASRRLSQYGLNELQASHRISPWSIFVQQFKNILIVILLVATIISIFLGHGTEAIVIAVIVLFAVVLGFVQEYRAERAIEALRQMAALTATVFRDGVEIEIPAHNLVPGDVILSQAGNRVPADVRLIEAINLQVEEAALTGESMPIEKNVSVLNDSEIPIGDRKNMTYAGTTVSYGRGRGIVVATGMNTEFGKIAQMLQTVEIGRTPLQENLNKIGGMLARAGVGVVALIVALGLLRGQPFLEMFIFGIALAVAVVPEALPAVVTISLAIGVQRMVKRNALIRRLPAVETLGSTSIICSDKTGTLTKDEMTARKVFVSGQMWEVTGVGYEPVGHFLLNNTTQEPTETLRYLLMAAALASDASIVKANDHWRIKGDPTEGAMVVAAAKAGLNKTLLDKQFPRVNEIPFSSEKKRMTTLHVKSNNTVAYAKGAPEVILESCTMLLVESNRIVIDAVVKESILAVARQMAGEALRVLAIASKDGAKIEDAEKDMTFLGLIGLIDPPRQEAISAVKTCKHAGIKVQMITGDHPVTAQAIARELEILQDGGVIVGVELESMDDAELEHKVKNIEVYARVSPIHKLRVVTALQNQGYVVAMTGDGVNDAPALKKADIGIAMGITGTDVSKEASAMTLLDDNFASIVAAVEEGRAIFGNIKKYLMYLLSSNIGEILVMAGASLFGLPLPLSAVQILYVNLATDGLPALALSMDPPEHDLMRRPPRNTRTGIFTRPVIILMIVGGLWSAIVNLSVFSWALNTGVPIKEAMTITFTSLVLIQFFKAFNFRSDRHSVLNRPFANRWLNLAILWETLLLTLIVTVPFLEKAFGTVKLSLVEWIMIVAVAFSVTPVLEIAKWMERRGWFGKIS